MIQTINLTKNFGKWQALQDINLQIEKGSIVGLIGKNGSGKTTLLKLISGLLIPSNGKILNQSDKLSYMMDVAYYYEDASLLNNLKITTIRKNIHTTEEFMDILKEVDLQDDAKKKFNALSLGMKKRFNIAQTFCGNPDIILLDEPTNGLDKDGIALFYNMLKNNINNDKTILMTNHRIEDYKSFCTHILYLEKGKVKDYLPIKDFENKYPNLNLIFKENEQ